MNVFQAEGILSRINQEVETSTANITLKNSEARLVVERVNFLEDLTARMLESLIENNVRLDISVPRWRSA